MGENLAVRLTVLDGRLSIEKSEALRAYTTLSAAVRVRCGCSGSRPRRDRGPDHRARRMINRIATKSGREQAAADGVGVEGGVDW